MKPRHAVVYGLLLFAIAGCSNEPVTASAYAAEIEQLVAGMEVQFAALDDDWVSQPPSLERAREYWVERLQIRNDFLSSLRAMEPPEEVAPTHQEALDIFTRITEADVALEARVATFDSISDHWQWVDTPEGRAADAVLEEVFAFCRSSQEEFDATKERQPFDDSAWLPAEMREVVRVSFGCPPQDG